MRSKDWRWPAPGKHSPSTDEDVALTYDDVKPDLETVVASDLAEIVPPITVILVPARDEVGRQLAHVRGGFVIREAVHVSRESRA